MMTLIIGFVVAVLIVEVIEAVQKGFNLEERQEVMSVVVNEVAKMNWGR